MSETVYATVIRGTTVYGGSSLEDAIRTWDQRTVGLAGPVEGGIEVKTFDGPVMVRDGWLLHVNADGVVYLNPRIGTEG